MNGIDVSIIEKIDRKAIQSFLLPRLILMENAGRQVAENALNFFKPKRVFTVCGGGFNGGDGLVAARYLCEYIENTTVILTAKEEKLKEETRRNLEILKKLNIKIIHLKTLRGLQNIKFKKSDLIIDALIGIGLKLKIKGLFKGLIDKINKSNAEVVSVDIPSGLSAQEGVVCGSAIKAKMTVTFTFPKKGMYLAEGPKYCGKIRVVDIGIPEKVIKEVI